jgi:S1-C subfamily serine protease
MRIVVEIIGGARAGERLEFTAPAVIRFGRHPMNEVAFDPHGDRDASSRHAELRADVSGVFVQDLRSANGTLVDGQPVAERAPVPSGGTIEFGRGGPRCRILYDVGAVPPTVCSSAASAPAAAAPPHPTTGGAKKIGARTVAMMIDDALRRARGQHRRWQWLAVGLGAALVLVIAAAVAMKLRTPTDAALRRKMVQLMDEQRTAAESERAALQKKLDELAARLASRGASGAAIARENHDAIYLVTVRTSITEEGFCTAFAVSADRLITNAHCVALADDFHKRGGQIFVVQNGHAERRLPVVKTRRVRGFAGPGGISPDVGWLKVPGGLTSKVTLATPDEYRALSTGDPMFTYGFPGRLADVSAPEATFVEGTVGRITTLDGRSGDVRETRLIQHSAFTTGGTSGSPIFNGAGHVVAVNTGGYAEAVASGKGEAGQGAVVSRSLPGYNFGMRVDLVEELLAEGD